MGHKKMEETKASTPWAKVTFSSIVEHALIELRNSESEIFAQKTSSKPSNISPDVSAEIMKPYKRSVGGSSKAGTARYQKGGRRKSST
jgi:hypothetical protein